MAESIFNGSKVSFYVITKSEYDKIENKSLENVKNLPHNAVIFCNDETCYKMYVTDNNGNALPVITSIKNYSQGNIDDKELLKGFARSFVYNETNNTTEKYYVHFEECKDENGQLYGLRWNPDERIEIGNDDLNKVHKVVAIYL